MFPGLKPGAKREDEEMNVRRVETLLNGDRFLRSVRLALGPLITLFRGAQ